MLWIGTAISLASTLIPTISKLVTGGKQGKEAERLRAENPRPKYEIPRSQKESMEYARLLGTQGIQGKSKIEDKLRSSTAGAVRSAEQVSQDPASKLAAITGVYGQEMENLQDLEISDAQARVQGMQQLMGALQGNAQYEQQDFLYNKDEPYRNAMAAASALTGASMQNKQEGLEGIAQSVSPVIESGIEGAEEKRGSMKAIMGMINPETGVKYTKEEALAKFRQDKYNTGSQMSSKTSDLLKSLLGGIK